MSKVAVIGVSGDDQLWLVDFASGTVSPFTQPAESDLAKAVTLRQQGSTIVKGVDFAIAFSSAAVAASGHHES
ncbi:hypothetical protein [Agrobacterium sp.]|uniref:hypothetical protein n=1 Tax=Agrobacterium sp. TaxID=361 RepID=UPI0028AC90FE|nr:hypothetical protein [Agrobacterium sp.]